MRAPEDRRRSSGAPELPTIAEAGVKGYRTTTWYGLLAPAGTPAAIVSRLSGDMKKAVESNEVKGKILSDGAEPVGGTPQQFHEHLVAEIARAKEIIQRAGVTR